MMKFICLMLLTFISLSYFSESVSAQKRKIPREPFQFTDATTGEKIPEVLVITRYMSSTGLVPSVLLPKKDIFRNYLDKPFIYQSGKPFIINGPKFNKVPVIQLSVGIGRDVESVLIVAPKYRPLAFSNLWIPGDIRKVQLTPISDEEWQKLLREKLNPLTEQSVIESDDYRFWDLPNEKFTLHIYYDKKERELVKTFLQKAE